MIETPLGTGPFTLNGGDNPTWQIQNKLDALGRFASSTSTYKISSNITIPVGIVTVNNELAKFIPAGALVTSLGLFFTENISAGASSAVSVAFGTASAGVDLVASTALTSAGESGGINSLISTSNGAKLATGGAAIVAAVAAPFYFGNENSLFLQTINVGTVLGATCDVKVVMEYIPGVSNV